MEVLKLIRDIFAVIGYIGIGLIGIAYMAEKHTIIDKFYDDGNKLWRGVKILVSLTVWPIFYPILISVIIIHNKLIKYYSKHKNKSIIQKTIIRSKNRIYNFYCENGWV